MGLNFRPARLIRGVASAMAQKARKQVAGVYEVEPRLPNNNALAVIR